MFNWLASVLGQALHTVSSTVSETGGAILNGMAASLVLLFTAAYQGVITLTSWFWDFMCQQLIGWVGVALSLLNIEAGDVSPFVNMLAMINWFFPLDMLIVLFPSWCAFECSLLATRVLIRAWR